MKVNVQKMEETLSYKFQQHPQLKHMLLATGEAELVEDSDKDSFWGVGADRKGRNELGKALGRLRTGLRKKSWTAYGQKSAQAAAFQTQVDIV